ncbi:MAG: flagellar hook-basal body complex protein FliE [Pedosphaera sp.]|nr:flagellar hook-basal body complex protein FliE [Pedosphaera sp.]
MATQQAQSRLRTAQAEAGSQAAGAEAAKGVSGSFGTVLNQFVGDVNDKQLGASAALNGLLAGQDVPLHRVVIAMEEASVAFQMMVEVRNKLLEGYQELMRMQV